MTFLVISILFYIIHSTFTMYFWEPTIHCSRNWGNDIKCDRSGPYLQEACIVYFLCVSYIFTFIFLLPGSAKLNCPHLLSPSFSSYSCHLSLPKTHHRRDILQGSDFQLFFFFLYSLCLCDLTPFNKVKFNFLYMFPKSEPSSKLSPFTCLFTEKICTINILYLTKQQIYWLLCVYMYICTYIHTQYLVYTYIYYKYTAYDSFLNHVFLRLFHIYFLASIIFN